MLLTLVPVLIQDEESGGYTAYYETWPEVVSQGATKEEAVKNLEEDFKVAVKWQVITPPKKD